MKGGALMHYKWIELYGYAGIYNGMGLMQMKIDFTKCKSNKVIIRGSNGSGKSTLINAINPNPDSNDKFMPNSEARKNICLVDNGTEYVIRYIHPITNSGRGTTKGYIAKTINGQLVELNPNGNISSCKDILYEEFNLDSNFISLSRLSSEDTIGYSDIEFISDQLAMGVIDDVQWDFIKTCPAKDVNSLKVVHTSYERPIFDNDIISIVSYDDNDEETKYKINFSGTKLSEGNVLDLSIESGEVVPQSEDKQEPVEEVKDIVVPIVTIGRFIFVNDDSVKLSEHSNLIYSKKSLHKSCNVEKGTICWILAKENVIIITRRDGISDYRRPILYKKDLPSDYSSFSVLDNSKWYMEDCFICSEEENILDAAVKTIRTKLQAKVDSIEIKQQTNENLVTNDTKDTLKLKAI